MALQKLTLTEASNHGIIWARKIDGGYRIVLVFAAGQNKVVNLPSGTNIVMFSAEADFWVRGGGDATPPGADQTDGNAPELNPVVLDVSGLSSINVYSQTAQRLGIVCYV